MLAGIVVSNAILLVDYTNILRRRDGKPLREAVELAGRTRLRPILMTTLATILGLVPMSLGIGEGAELQAPLARVVIGGLTASTLVTLVLVPTRLHAVRRRLDGIAPRGGALAILSEPRTIMKKTGCDSRSPGGRGRRRRTTTTSTASPSRSRRSSRPRSRRATSSRWSGDRHPRADAARRRRLAGLRRRQGDLRRLQLHREAGPGARGDRPVACSRCRSRSSKPTSSGRRCDIANQEVQLEDAKMQARAHAGAVRQAAGQSAAARAARAGRQEPRGADRRRPRSSWSSPKPNLRQAKLNVSYTTIVLADRRRRRRAPRRSRPDGAGEHERADVLRARDRPARR